MFQWISERMMKRTVNYEVLRVFYPFTNPGAGLQIHLLTYWKETAVYSRAAR